jgi:hypothetical protein
MTCQVVLADSFTALGYVSKIRSLILGDFEITLNYAATAPH